VRQTIRTHLARQATIDAAKAKQPSEGSAAHRVPHGSANSSRIG
jgi:hypothetical protein